MPVENYFLSKVAAQIPGPLVTRAIVKTEPTSCLELVPATALNPVINDQSNVDLYKTCQDMAVLPCHLSKDSKGYVGSYSRPVARHPVHMPWNPQVCQSPLPVSIKGLEENPVGELQELCTRMRWVFPSYTVCSEDGQPHERIFVIAVRLYNISDKGEAKSKKAAKRDAARNLLSQLLERSCGQSYSTQTPSAAIEYRPAVDIPSKVVTQQHQHNQDSLPYSKCIDMLQELAMRRNLRVVFIRLDSLTSSGLIKVMLQISTCPIVVVSGQGRTILEAKAEAALNALECIRITAKKMPFQTINFTL